MRALPKVAILLVLASCSSPTVPPPMVTKLRGAASGQLQPIDYFYYVNTDCSSTGSAQIHVLRAPDHGTFTTERGQQPIAFAPNNAHAVCNGKMTPATFLRYQSQPSYVGGDRVEVEVIGPFGADNIIEYNVNVRPAT